VARNAPRVRVSALRRHKCLFMNIRKTSPYNNTPGHWTGRTQKYPYNPAKSQDSAKTLFRRFSEDFHLNIVIHFAGRASIAVKAHIAGFFALAINQPPIGSLYILVILTDTHA